MLSNLFRAIACTAALAVPGGAASADEPKPLVVAVNDTPCGWYVIYMCSRERSEAQYWYDLHEAMPGVVVTTGPDTPNFAPGWFCVANGPMDREAAIAGAEDVRAGGSAPEAYAKNSCR